MGCDKCSDGLLGAQMGCRPDCCDSKCKPGEFSFLLLLTLFILLASCVTTGIKSNFIFIIILAVIAFGGFGDTFFGGKLC